MGPIPPDDLESPARTEQIRLSVVMLPPGSPAGLSREDAIIVIEALQRLQALCAGRDCCK